MSKLVLRAFAIVAVAGTLSVPTQAQTASNNIPANCTQTSSTTISCQSTLTFTVPAGLITLQSQPTGTGFAPNVQRHQRQSVMYRDRTIDGGTRDDPVA